MVRLSAASLFLLVVPQEAPGVAGFVPRGSIRCDARMMGSSLSRNSLQMQQTEMPESRLRFVSGLLGGVAALALPIAAVADPPLEKFKPDEVCLQRGLNGACTKFGVGDAAGEVVSIAKQTPVQEEPESELIATLKRRTIENKAKNDEEVATQTFLNGQAGEFGPFSRYVPVKHKDTGKYELVLIADLDEMKRKGLVTSERGVDYFAAPE